MAHTPESVIKALKENEYAPLYLLHGEEPFYIDLISNFIEENALQEQEKEFNQIILYGKDINTADIVNNAKRFPMMSDKQVVIIKEGQNVKGLNNKINEEILIKYLDNPLPSTILVFCFKNSRMNKTKRLYKSFDKNGIVVESNKIKEESIPDWTQNYVTEKGHTIGMKAAMIFTEHVGNNLERLSNEIDKLLINFHEKTEITPVHIDKYVGISKDYNTFELQRSIAVKDIMKANRIVNYFSSNTKSHPVIPIISVLFGFFSRLMIYYHKKNLPEREIAKHMNLPWKSDFVPKEYKLAARNYSLAKVISNIQHLKEADLMSKGVGVSRVEDGEILKELVFKLMH
jgi:DNA polymerase-3 subunit delta